MIKTPVININNIKFDKILNNLQDNQQNNQQNIIYKPLNYKYSDSIESEFKIFVNWTNVKILTNKSNKNDLIFQFSDQNIIKIINDMTNYLNFEHSGCNVKFKNNLSQVTLIPSKKSNLEPYTIKKSEGFDQIDKYFPLNHKSKYNKNPTINIVGKFILQAFVFKIKQSNKSYISLKIINAEIKYEPTFIKDDEIKLESVYNNHITMSI